MSRSRIGVLALAVALGSTSIANAYFLDKGRNFDVRGRFYSQISIAAQDAREEPPIFALGDMFSHRNFYNPEFDAKLTDYVQWAREVPGLSLIAPDEFKFRFAWWGFYDGMFDYLEPQWANNLDTAPRARQSSSNAIKQESYDFNDENKNPRNILGRRNRINEMYLDYTKGRLFFRLGRQSISWGESDTIVLLDVINTFDLTMGAPGLFMDLEEARIPFWALRSTVKLFDSLGPISSSFVDMYMVPGPVDTTVPITAPAFFGFPYSQPGLDPAQNPDIGYLFNPVPISVSIVDRIPKSIWSETRWGVRLAGVLAREYTVSGWFFRTYPTAPVPLLLGDQPSISRTDIEKTLVDNRGFKTPVCLDANGNQISQGRGFTPAGRPCKFAIPVVTALYRRLTSVAGIAGSWYSGTLGGIIRTEAEFFIDQDAFIPTVNLDPQVQVPNGQKKVNSIAKADYLRWTIGYDRFFFFRPLNPANSFIVVAAHNGQWNASASHSKDYRFNGLAKPGKNQIEGAIIPGVPACSQRPANGKFPLTCQIANPKNFEDEYVVEQFFQFALQTDYLHGKLTPRIVAILDPSGIFAFQTAFNYRFTDSLIGTLNYIGIAATRRAGIGTFRDRDQVQMRLTYQLN